MTYCRHNRFTLNYHRKLAHNFMISHLVFLFCLLDLVKTLITENKESILIISVYRERISDLGTL